MVKNFKLLIVMLVFNATLVQSIEALKALHLSFHIGCVKDFDLVARHLNLDLDSWFIHDSPSYYFDGCSKQHTDQIYDISHERAKSIWEKHKSYFDQFDVIITSDTAPLSRIFLQNGWKKPLIIWICNRFDYAVQDGEYYELMRKASKQKNVKIIGYVAYEHFYAKSKGVDTGNLIIKPCGSLEDSMRESNQSFVPVGIKKEDTFLIPQRSGWEVLYTMCKKLEIPVYCGKYNGPYDIKDFKGIIHFPYQWSNLALFENMQLGLIHFVPSQKLLNQWFYFRTINYPFYALNDMHHLELSEWYCAEHKDFIVYFDSWEDLQIKLKTTDYQSMQEKIKSFGKKHNEEMLNRWQVVFADLQN